MSSSENMETSPDIVVEERETVETGSGGRGTGRNGRETGKANWGRVPAPIC